ncbi:UvrD-helicase domain-containing protein [Acinetobacter schindleri]|uniref:UvrD-helicase domain-containing protein n=2 Tax=Acinetobacter TaxID=469 RepID=UPI0032B524A0
MQHNSIDLEELIFNYVTNNPPESFILYAGAGSGKTHTLHQVLKKIKMRVLRSLTIENKKLAVITYTNAACDEIKERVNFDNNFFVSTIHSFAWSLIEPFTKDIKEVLSTNLSLTLLKEEELLKNARDKNNKTNLARQMKIQRIKQRLLALEAVKRFTYNPNSSSIEKASLEHSEVIEIFSRLLSEKTSFKKILVNKYPIIFLDEAQDTYEKIISALINIQLEYSDKFIIGLFGDNMQRIFPNNKNNLDLLVPVSWQRPKKTDNWRCSQRIVDLINKIRLDDDRFEQQARQERIGFARCIIVNTNIQIDKLEKEEQIRQHMSVITNDEMWKNSSEVKTLILEHHMAAIRSGFHQFYKPLYDEPDIRTKLSNSDTQSLRFLVGVFHDFITAIKSKDEFQTIKLIRNYSEIFNHITQQSDQLTYLKKIREKKNELYKLLENNSTTIKDVLSYIYEHQLLNIPPTLIEILQDDLEPTSEAIVYKGALNADLSNLINYANYIHGRSSFDTHQGVKGLQFDRVMAILDDDEAGGFLFNYNKLLGVKELSTTDLDNESKGLDSALSRTRRLFYVICSRAKNSLAIVCYTKDPIALKSKLIEKKWFVEDEIILI